MKRKSMSVVDDLRIHHLFDDEAKVDFKIKGEFLMVMVGTDDRKEVVAKIELPDFGCE